MFVVAIVMTIPSLDPVKTNVDIVGHGLPTRPGHRGPLQEQKYCSRLFERIEDIRSTSSCTEIRQRPTWAIQLR
jgi:hypothetical protein